MAKLFGTTERASARVAPVAVLTLALAMLLPASAAVAAPVDACDQRANNTYQKLLECMTLEGVREHQAAFQKIADNSDDPFYPGTRAAGHRGLRGQRRVRRRPAAGRRLRGDPRPGRDHVQLPGGAAAAHAGRGRATRPASSPAAARAPSRARSSRSTSTSPAIGRRTSGCEAADFAGIDWSGDDDIALIQRGTCFFGTKAYYAEQAGAEAVIIFNQGNTPDREGLIVADATSVDPPIPGAPGPVTHGIPVVGASFADGVALAQPGSTAFIEVLPAETRTDYNVIAELPGKNDGQRRDGRRPPRQRHRGPGDQRQRLRLGRAAGDRAADGQPQPGEHAAVRLVGRRGAGPARLGGLRRRAVAGGARPHRAVHELRHGRLAELHLHGVRLGRVDLRGAGGRSPPGSDRDRGPVRVVLHAGSASRTTTPSSPGAATTRRSSWPASRPAACSPAPR